MFMNNHDLKNYLAIQAKKFCNTLLINLLFLLGLMIFWAINLYSSIKNVNNSRPNQILIYDGLTFFTIWVLATIVKNYQGYFKLQQLKKMVTQDHQLGFTGLINFPLYWIFYGGYYHLIEQELNNLVPQDWFHQTQVKTNLKYLNWKAVLLMLVLLLSGLGFFLSMVIYFPNPNFKLHWQLVFTLCLLVIFCLLVFCFLLPRQVILNLKVKLNQTAQISQDAYFNHTRYFGLTNTLTKLWIPPLSTNIQGETYG